ncbi:hypothetical protein ACT4UT_13525, partial [Bacillus sp. B-TM1]
LIGFQTCVLTVYAVSFLYINLPAFVFVSFYRTKNETKTKAGKLIYRKETAYPFMKTDMPFIICIKFLYIGVETA